MAAFSLVVVVVVITCCGSRILGEGGGVQDDSSEILFCLLYTMFICRYIYSSNIYNKQSADFVKFNMFMQCEPPLKFESRRWRW